jgi:putative copper export protein
MHFCSNIGTINVGQPQYCVWWERHQIKRDFVHTIHLNVACHIIFTGLCCAAELTGGGILFCVWQAKLNQIQFLHRLGQMGSVLSIVQLTPPDVSHDVASCVRRGLVAPNAVGFAKFYLGLEYVGHGALRKNTFAQTVLSVVHMQSGSLWSAT